MKEQQMRVGTGRRKGEAMNKFGIFEASVQLTGPKMGRENLTPINSGRVRIVTGTGDMDWIDVSPSADGKGVEIRGGESLIVLPEMSNVVKVKLR